jgi:hypothetical protein
MSASRPSFPPELGSDIGRRAVHAWIALRIFLLFTAPLAGVPVVGALMSVGVITLVGSVALLDVRVCRETLLLANLGVSPAQVLARALPRVALLESLTSAAIA